VPVVPDNANQDAKDAAFILSLVKDDMDDCLTYMTWLDELLVESCDELGESLHSIVDEDFMQAPAPQFEAEVMESLFMLLGEEDESLDDFTARMRERFETERADPEGDVEEMPTGVVIPDTPAMCQPSTHDAVEWLITYDDQLQDEMTYNNWLNDLLEDSIVMNEKDCDDLAQEYAELIDSNFDKIAESQDRQVGIMADAFMVKGLDGETFDDFQARYHDEFDTYVPLPVFPNIDYKKVPATCQESTIEAFGDFEAFLDLLSAELTYETWTSEKLEECCEDLENQITSMVDEARLDEFAETKEAKLNDLFLLNGEDGEERLEYYLKVI
jgi:hypothetical protein